MYFVKSKVDLVAILVMGIVDHFVSTFDKCFELSIHSNERPPINCVLTLYSTKVKNIFADSAVAILPVSVN